jgi:hypothetical protein
MEPRPSQQISRQPKAFDGKIKYSQHREAGIRHDIYPRIEFDHAKA